jgi:hypothetical protein
MAVAADREFERGVRHPQEIEGLQVGAAAEEGEWRRQHATVAQPDQCLHPALGREPDQFDRVALGDIEAAEFRSWQRLSPLFAQLVQQCETLRGGFYHRRLTALACLAGYWNTP